MAIDGQPEIPHSIAGVRVEQVFEEPLQGIARNIMGEAFHMDHPVNLRLVRPEHTNDHSIHHYVAYCDGHPAAAATMTYTPSVAGIWNVGTRRIFRRRGLASALMARLCQDAIQDGYPYSMLMASSMGRPLYAKIGYREVAEVYYLGFSAY